MGSFYLQGFLVREACVGVLVGGAGFLLSGVQWSDLFLKTMICFSGCLMSSASLQKLFCEVCSALKCSFEEFTSVVVSQLWGGRGRTTQFP